MVRPPGYLDKIQSVVNFFEEPCSAPWVVYIELAKEPAGNVILALLSFGMDDVLRGFFRPKGLRTRRHGRKGRKSRKGVGIPELGELLGSKLPGAEEVKARQHVRAGEKLFWLVDGVTQRLLWYWMVFDLTVDFFYEWTTLIQESEFCSKSGSAGCCYTSNHESILALVGWHAVSHNIREYQRGDCSASGAGGGVGPGTWDVSFSANVKDQDPRNPYVELAVVRSVNPFNPISDIAGFDATNPLNTGAIATGSLIGPATFITVARCGFGKVDFDSVACVVSGGQ